MKRFSWLPAAALLAFSACDDKGAANAPAPDSVVRAGTHLSAPAGAASKQLREFSDAGSDTGAASPVDWGRVRFDGGRIEGGGVSVPRAFSYGPRQPIKYTSVKSYSSSDLALPEPPSPLTGVEAARYAGLRTALRWMGSDPRVVDEIIRQAIPMGLDPVLMLAMGRQENGLTNNPTPSRSRNGRYVGALGVLQLMPETACRMGVCSKAALLVPEVNVRLGLTYFKQQMRIFHDDVHLALAAYNAGPGAVFRSGRRVPPYRETQGYVRNILALARQFRRFVS